MTRLTPEIIPSDSAETQNQPRILEQTKKWLPEQGADVVNIRYAERLNINAKVNFPLVSPENAEDALVWERFALEIFGFVPSTAAASDQRLWQNFLRDEYQNSLARLNQSHDSSFQDFEDVFLPRGTESSAELRADWQKFIEITINTSRNRKLWQDFLARRYRRIGQLNEFYGTNWSSFEYVSLFDRLPSFEKPLTDWLQFEGGILPMHRTAHRFTVMIPAVTAGGKPFDSEEQRRKLELVRRVVELEKPAHTTFDFRFYWNLFRLDEVRLGLDTLLGLGSRDPLLNPDLLIGQSFIGESRLGIEQPEKYSERYVLGSEFLEKK